MLLTLSLLIRWAIRARRDATQTSSPTGRANDQNLTDTWVTSLELESALHTWVDELRDLDDEGLVSIKWLSGHRGIGKTSFARRVQHELAYNDSAASHPAPYFFYGSCLGHAHSEAYLCPPFAEALKDYLGYKYFENPQLQLSQINQQIHSHKLLSTLKPVQIFTELFGTMRSEDVRENLDMLKESVYLSFIELLQQRSVFFMIDETHLIDAASRELLCDLVTRLTQRSEARSKAQALPLNKSLTFVLIHQVENLSHVRRFESELRALLPQHDQFQLSQRWELVTPSELKQRGINSHAHPLDEGLPRSIISPSVTRILSDSGLSHSDLIRLCEAAQIGEDYTPHIAQLLIKFQHAERLEETTEITPWLITKLIDRLTEEMRARCEALEAHHPDDELEQLLLICTQLTRFKPTLDPLVVQIITGMSEWEALNRLKLLYQSGWLTILNNTYQLRSRMDHDLLLKYFERDDLNRPLVHLIHVHQACHLFNEWSQRGRSHRGAEARALVTVFEHASLVPEDTRVPFYEITREVTQVEPGRWGEVVFRASLHTLYASERKLLTLTVDERSLLLSQYLWYLFNHRPEAGGLRAQCEALLRTREVENWLPSGDPHASQSLERTVVAHLNQRAAHPSLQKTRLEVALQNHRYQKNPTSLAESELTTLSADPDGYRQRLTLSDAIVLFFQLARIRVGFHERPEHMQLLEFVTDTLTLPQHREDSYPVWTYALNHRALRVKAAHLNEAYHEVIVEALAHPQTLSKRKRQRLSVVITDHKRAVELFDTTYRELSINAGQYDLASTESQYADALYDLALASLLNLSELPERTLTSAQRARLNALQGDLITDMISDWPLYEALVELSGVRQRAHSFWEIDSPFKPLIPICLASAELLKRSIQDHARRHKFGAIKSYSRLASLYVTYLEVLFQVLMSRDHDATGEIPSELALRLRFTYHDARDAYRYSLGLCHLLGVTEYEHQERGLKRLNYLVTQFASIYSFNLEILPEEDLD